jgi:chaperonin GroES
MSNSKTSKNKIAIKPLSDRVVLEEISATDSKTASGIIIPESADSDKDTKKGKVVAVGEGRMVDGILHKPQVKVGDTVLYSWGDNVVVNGTKYIIVGADNISAIIN